jgi:hypothetical protein
MTMTVLRKKEKESSKLRLGGGSWTINMDKLDRMAEPPDVFLYMTERGYYQITYQEAFEHGFIRCMGGEMKLIVPIKNWDFHAREA